MPNRVERGKASRLTDKRVIDSYACLKVVIARAKHGTERPHTNLFSTFVMLRFNHTPRANDSGEFLLPRHIFSVMVFRNLCKQVHEFVPMLTFEDEARFGGVGRRCVVEVGATEGGECGVAAATGDKFPLAVAKGN